MAWCECINHLKLLAQIGILWDIIINSSSQSSQPIIPVTSLLNSNPVLAAESVVNHALDVFIATRALQKTNHMDIESLLNPVGESHILTETSDREIFKAVMETTEAHETIEVNRGDDVDEYFPAEPQPSWQDVLKATSTISKFIVNMDDPIAHKLEGLISSLNMQLHPEESRKLKDTHSTCYIIFLHFFASIFSIPLLTHNP